MTTTARAFAIRVVASAVLATGALYAFIYPIPKWTRPIVFEALDWLPSFVFASAGDVGLPIPNSLLVWYFVQTFLRLTLFLIALSYAPAIAIWLVRSAVALVKRSGPDSVAIASWAALGGLAGASTGAFAWAQWNYKGQLSLQMALWALGCGVALPVFRCWARERLSQRRARPAGAA